METEQFEFSEDPKKVFEELVKKALEGKHSDFEFIRTYETCKVARYYKIGVKSCNCDSFTAIFEELAKMLDGGYYDEVQDLHYYENNEKWKEASLEELEEDFKERD